MSNFFLHLFDSFWCINIINWLGSSTTLQLLGWCQEQSECSYLLAKMFHDLQDSDAALAAAQAMGWMWRGQIDILPLDNPENARKISCIYIQYRYTNLPYVLAIQRTLEVYGKYVGKRSLCSRGTRWLKCPDSSGSSLGSSNGACQGLRAPQQDLQGPVQISCLSYLSSLQVHRKMFLLETSQEGKRHCHIAVVNMS